MRVKSKKMDRISRIPISNRLYVVTLIYIFSEQIFLSESSIALPIDLQNHNSQTDGKQIFVVEIFPDLTLLVDISRNLPTLRNRFRKFVFLHS